jgi:HEAT repeat protein
LLALTLGSGCQGWKSGGALSRWLANPPPADAAQSQAEEEARRQKTLAELAEQRQSQKPQIRATAMTGLAKHRHPHAVEWLSAAGANDIDLQVRMAAVAGLAALATPEAQQALEDLTHGSGDAVRAAAIDALARCSSDVKVLDNAGDPSRRVRMSVAGALGRFRGPEAVAAAEKLLADRSVEVQSRTVAAVAAWPIEEAGPVWLEAMEKAGFAGRKAAAEQLVARWPRAAEYQIDDPPERRAAVLQRLREQFPRDFPPARPAVAAATAMPPSLPAEMLARAEACVRSLDAAQLDSAQRQQALAGLNELGADLQPALTALVVQRRLVLPDLVYSDVLAGKDPLFAQLELLKSPTATERRRAATALAQALAKRPPGLLVEQRLAAVLIHESDPLVWETMLGALAPEPGEPAMRLARAALRHNSPEVRRRACLNLAAHPTAEDESLLAGALSDSSSAVAIAAAQGLGALRQLRDPRPLRHAAQNAAEPLRSEAIVALARLGDPFGEEGLMRLAASGDPILRRRAALVMGELGEPRYASPLAAMLLDRPAVQTAALQSLKQIAGRDVASEGGRPSDSAELVRRWKRWADTQAVR